MKPETKKLLQKKIIKNKLVSTDLIHARDIKSIINCELKELKQQIEQKDAQIKQLRHTLIHLIQAVTNEDRKDNLSKGQHLFEALQNVCNFTALESDMDEIIDAVKKDNL